MNSQTPSYRSYIQFQSQRNPCLAGLAKYLDESGPGYSSSIVSIEFPRCVQSAPQNRVITEGDLVNLIQDSSTASGRILLVENIHAHLIASLGEVLDIDPIFFAGHITTDFQDIERVSAPPALALLPSQLAERGFLHLHYQQILDLGNAEEFYGAPYNLKSDANTPRNVRRLPSLSGRQLAIARACCSVMVKDFQNSWICLILIDPFTRTLIERLDVLNRKIYPAQLLNGGFEDITQPASFACYKSGTGEQWSEKKSMLNYMVRYLHKLPPDFKAANPTILSLGYYPMRIILSEWNAYIHLTSRYLKYYEYTLHNETRLHDSDIIDLQRWRRRSTQSQHKLIIITEFIEYWLQQRHQGQHHDNFDSQPWVQVLRDIKHVQSRFEHFSHCVEQMVPIATTMVQLLGSQRLAHETTNVSRLTFIALIFVPLSWVASVFNMPNTFSPGQEHFWVYFAVALPALLLVLLLSAVPWSALELRLGALRRKYFTLTLPG